MTTLRTRLAALRPAQWVKNVPVAAPLLFGHRLAEPEARLDTLGTLVAFCAVASAGYLVNDVRDRDADRAHPRRARRPVARGDVPPGEALAAAALLAGGTLAVAAWRLPAGVAAVLAGYLALSLAYSFGLKRLAPLGVAVVAAGFVARVLAGAYAARVTPSPWLLALVGVLALALAVSKREAEARRVKVVGGAVAAGGPGGPNPRALAGATDALLLASWLGYVAYGLDPATVALHHTRLLPLTALPVAAALVRFRSRLRADRTGLGPAELTATDPVLLLLGVVWAVACALVVGAGTG